MPANLKSAESEIVPYQQIALALIPTIAVNVVPALFGGAAAIVITQFGAALPYFVLAIIAAIVITTMGVLRIVRPAAA